jgi:virginiamycin B lyase
LRLDRGPRIIRHSDAIRQPMSSWHMLGRRTRVRLPVPLAVAMALFLPSTATADLYWAHSGFAIGRSSPDGSTVEPKFVKTGAGALSPVGVAVGGEHIYWTEENVDGFIGRAELDGGNVDSTLIAHAEQARGIAVEGNHVYWTEELPKEGVSQISRSKLDGSEVQRELVRLGPGITGLAADAGHLYWSSTGTSSIGRAKLDGTEVEPHFISAGSPRGVAVDATHIYWTNGSTKSIGRAALNGGGPEPEFIAHAGQVTGVAVDAEHVYWSTGGENLIGSAGLDGGEVKSNLIENGEGPELMAADRPEVPAEEPPEPVGPSPLGPSPLGSGSSIIPATPNEPTGFLSVHLESTAAAFARRNFTLLHIASTGPAEDTKISIDGGQPILHINPLATPYVALRMAATGSHTITATTIGSGGGTASSSMRVTITPGIKEFKKPSFFPDIAVATSDAKALLEGVSLAAVSRECVPGSTVVFGVAEATGCFKQIEDAEEIPSGERGVAEEYVEQSNIIEHLTANAAPFLRHSASYNALEPALKPFDSSQPVHLDGMTIAPRPGASVVVFPAIGRVVSSNARVSYDGSVFGSIPVQTGALNLDLDTTAKRFSNGDAELPLFHFNTSQVFDAIGGFPIDGDVQVVFKKTGERRYTALIVNVSLPEAISTAAGADPTAEVEVNADNERGTYLNHLNFHLGEAYIGPVQLANVDFTYDDGGNEEEKCPSKWWKATAEVFFIPVAEGEGSAGLKMAPEPQRNGVAFCAGKFHSAGAVLKFGEPIPPPEIFPGVSLNEIGFDFQLSDPTLFDGFATIKSAELVTATGGFLAVFASPGHPYTIKPGDAGGTLTKLVGHRFESTTMALGGSVSIEPVEGVGVKLGGAYLLYSYPGFVAADGFAHLQTFLFTINAEGSLELSTVTRKFNALAKGEVCLAGGIEVEHVGLCAGGEARVSSRGLSVCFDIAGWTPGVGYVYGASFPEFFAGALGDGCKPSHFWEKDVTAARVSAVAPITFTVKPGEHTKDIELTGLDGAPAVSLRAPDGETLSSQSNKMLHEGHLSAIAADKYKTTWLGVEDAKPGTYQISVQPGSPAVAKLAETRYEPDAIVKARVTGRGSRLTLHYDAGHAVNQKVTFIEKGENVMHPLRTVTGGSGVIAFEPQPGSARRREIVAVTEVDGIPGPEQTLASFSAPSPLAGAVSRVRVKRLKNALVLRWRPATNAKSYAVAVVERGGGVRTLRLRGGVHSVTVRGVPATEAGSVEVLAVGPLGDRGRAGAARFAATRREQSRLLPFRELGSGRALVPASKSHRGHRRH